MAEHGYRKVAAAALADELEKISNLGNPHFRKAVRHSFRHPIKSVKSLFETGQVDDLKSSLSRDYRNRARSLERQGFGVKGHASDLEHARRIRAQDALGKARKLDSEVRGRRLGAKVGPAAYLAGAGGLTALGVKATGKKKPPRAKKAWE
jgi:hypothetical protein